MGRQKKIGLEAQMLKLFLYKRTSISFPLIQWFSTCGLWTSSINGIWNLVRNSCPPLNPDLLNQKLWGLAICCNNPFKWSWCMLKLENHSFNPYVCILSHFNHVLTLCILWTVGHQALLSMGFSRQEYWSVLPCPPLRDLLNPGIELVSPALQVDSLLTEPPGSHLGRPLILVAIQSLGHLMQRINSLEKTLILETLKAKGEGGNRGWGG